MKVFQYYFSLNPDIADSKLVKDVQSKLSAHSIDTYVRDNSRIGPDQEGITREHVTKGYFINNGDLIRFRRLKNDSFNIFQVDINRKWRFTPTYFRNMLDKLGVTRDKGYSFSEIDTPDINKNVFKDIK